MHPPLWAEALPKRSQGRGDLCDLWTELAMEQEGLLLWVGVTRPQLLHANPACPLREAKLPGLASEIGHWV